MPEGVNGYNWWMFLYLMFKLKLYKSDSPLEINVGYRSPTSIDFQTDVIPLTDNSDGKQLHLREDALVYFADRKVHAFEEKFL
jgi:hypothetical protein